jgi:TonB family protein
MTIAVVTAVVAVGAPWSRSSADTPSPSPSPSAIAPSALAPVTDYDEPPKIVKQTKPLYPKKPFWDGVQGTVLIEFVVDETGSVRNPTIKESVPGLDDAALDCVKQWRFTPARKAGAPVQAAAQAPVTFRITERKKK